MTKLAKSGSLSNCEVLISQIVTDLQISTFEVIIVNRTHILTKSKYTCTKFTHGTSSLIDPWAIHCVSRNITMAVKSALKVAASNRYKLTVKMFNSIDYIIAIE